MKAVVIDEAGPPDRLVLRDWPGPTPEAGWVTIEVKAFGLNRSEMFTRQGHSPGVQFPRVLGIECVGVVREAPGGEFQPGQTVAAMMGEMGRAFDGGYAEVTKVPAGICFPLRTDLPWRTLGALPEMYQTVAGSLSLGLDLQAGHTLLIRGGTSSIGMTATALAKQIGATVLATTRNQAKKQALLDNGVDHVVIDSGAIAEAVREVVDGGVDRVLELIGTKTLADSLRCARPQGVVCMTGILGNEWVWQDFEPFIDIPNGVRLTSYGGDADNIDAAQLQGYVDAVADARIRVTIDRVFEMHEIVEAHQYMESNRAKGKLVVVTPSGLVDDRARDG